MTAAQEKKRVSPGAAALSDHAKLCSRCMAVAISGQPITSLCARGRILAVAALNHRMRRQAS